MDVILQLLATYGLVVVFVAVLLDQRVVPIPAWPVLILASAQAVDRGESLVPILVWATAAALLADILWYLGGRRYGAGMMRMICRVFLSPDTCVTSTRDLYAKWGAPSLIIAKFVPGFAAIGTTLAGMERTRRLGPRRLSQQGFDAPCGGRPMTNAVLRQL